MLVTVVGASSAAAGISIASAAGETAARQSLPDAWPRHGGPLRLLGKLGVERPAKRQIKDIIAAVHPQMQSLRVEMHENSAKLLQIQPTDPNYASISSQVSQTQGALAARLMAQRADLRAQVFKVLTPAQQTNLAALEAEKQAHRHGGARGPGS